MEKILEKPIESFKYIGPKTLKKLNRLGIETLKDLFFHFPSRYEVFLPKKIKDLKIGEKVSISGRIKSIQNIKTPKKKFTLTQAIVEDETGSIRCIWFNQPFLKKILKKGEVFSFAGKVETGFGGSFLSNPEYEKKFDKKKEKRLLHTREIVPIYPETEGISSKFLRKILYPLLIKFRHQLKEFLPKEILLKENFPEIKEALFEVHFPSSLESAKRAEKRFAFEELFLLQLLFEKEKKIFSQKKAIKILPEKEIVKKFVENLPFKLTEDQKRVIKEILRDLAKEVPMRRLLQGEVGCGKTVVASLIAAIVCAKGYQVAILSPTEILAIQHFEEIRKYLSPFDFKIALLTGKKALLSQKSFLFKEKETLLSLEKIELYEKLKKGEIDLLIGTHAILEKEVQFKKLALAIVDEQQRFGVFQRKKLTQASEITPHFLSMTATPIPRTLNLVLYGNLALSQIKTLPLGKRNVKIQILPPKERMKAFLELKEELKKGSQGYIIYPLIEKSEKLQTKAAKKEFEKIKKIFPEFKLALLHGKISSQEKERILKDFREGKIQVLVATGVVEVGIDVKNANFMIIEGAERFGLSQLYQLQGRIGRSAKEGKCILIPEKFSENIKKRLSAIKKAKNAFELAEIDLKLRGPGEFLGKRQTGLPDLSMISLRNLDLIEKAKEWAKKILKEDLFFKKYPLLWQKFEKFQKEIPLE